MLLERGIDELGSYDRSNFWRVWGQAWTAQAIYGLTWETLLSECQRTLLAATLQLGLRCADLSSGLSLRSSLQRFFPERFTFARSPTLQLIRNNAYVALRFGPASRQLGQACLTKHA